MCRRREETCDDEADEWKLHGQLPPDVRTQEINASDSVVMSRCDLHRVYPVGADGISLIFH